ncbi:MAG: DUF4347 domain-containing protein, partial [Pseudomonadota bacterium]
MKKNPPKPSASNPAGRAITRRKPRPLALEARLMFDGAAAASMLDAGQAHEPAPPAQREVDHGALQGRAQGPAQFDERAARLAEDGAAAAPAPRNEVAFIDTTIPGWQTLAAAIRSGVELVMLDPTRDAFTQMAEHLQGRQGLDAIHLITHGSEGAIMIGGQSFGGAELAQRGTDLAAIGRALGANGDLLLYGCDIGAGSAGAALLGALAEGSGADVAASTDATGAALPWGGDWALEASTGAIEAALFATADALAGFEGKLAVVNLSTSSGWVAIMYGAGKDPNGDSQAGAADTDIIGDATHGSLYTAYDDNGTATTADDSIVFRLRIDNPTSTTNFSGVAMVGMDANLDGKVDLFMAVDGRNNGQAVKLYDPGNGLNVSPNTTTAAPVPAGWLANGGVYSFNSTNYSVVAVSAASDPHYGVSSMTPGAPATDISGDGKADAFVSWRLPLADLITVMAKPSTVDAKTGLYGPRGATGIVFTKDTTVQYLSFTMTQTSSINGDLNGVDGSYDPNVGFGPAFSLPMTPANPISAGPGITITEPISGGYLNDAEDNSATLSGTTISIADGVKVTITATDGSSTLTFVDAATVSGGAWSASGLNLSALGNGTISFTATAGSASDGASVLHDKDVPTVSIGQLADAVSGKPSLSGLTNMPDGSLLTVTIDTDNVAATANLVYQVMVSSGAWTLNTATVAPVSGTMPTAGLNSYSKITVAATDSAGNVGSAVALNRPTVTALVTNDTTPVVTGTWANIPGDTLTVTVNGVSYTPSTSVGSNVWSVQVTTALATGSSYQVVATANRSGAVSVSDTSLLEVQVTNTPVVAIDIKGDSAGDPTSNGSASGTTTLPIINGSSANAGGFVIVRLDPGNDGVLGDAVTYSVVPAGDGTWTLDTATASPISGTRPTGGYTGAVGIRASDSTGAVFDTQLLTVVTPTIAIAGFTSNASSSVTFGAVDNTNTLLNAVEDDSVVLNGTAAGGTTVDLTITDANGNVRTVSGITVTGGVWTTAGTAINLSALDAGTLTVTATLNGTTATATNVSVSHDKTAPLIFQTTPSTVKKTAGFVYGGSELPNTSLTWTLTAVGATTQTGTVTTAANGDWSFTMGNINGPSTTGTISVRPTAATTDAAGNIVQLVSWTQALSSESNSTVSITSLSSGAAIENSEVAAGVTITGTTSLTGTLKLIATDSNGTTLTTWNSNTIVGGNWTATLSQAQIKLLTNGTIILKASAQDDSANDVFLTTLSLVSPVVTITDNVPGTASGTVLYTFTFSEALVIVPAPTFTIDDVTVVNGTKGTFTQVSASVYTLEVLPTAGSSGTMTVSVASGVALSNLTNRNNIGDSETQAFDRTAAANTPTVSIQTTQLATDSTPLIGGTANLSAGAAVVISIDNDNDGVAELSYSATVQANTTWSLDIGSATPSSGTLPAAGLNSYAKVTVTATNSIGTSVSATGLNRPSVTTLSTNDNTPFISGNWTQIAGDTLVVVVNGVNYSVANGNLTVGATTWSLTSAVLADGPYNVTATTTRALATAEDPTTAELTIDTLASIDITTNGGAATVLTNGTTPVIGGTVSGIADGTVLTLGFDTDNNGSYELTYQTVVTAGAWSVNTATAIPNSGTVPTGGFSGTVPVRINGSDAAGNAASDTQVFTFDVTGPAITFTINAKTADTTPVITGTTDLPAGSTIYVDVDANKDGDWTDAVTYTTTVSATGTWSVEATTPLAESTVALRARGTDLAGNSTSVTKPLQIQLVAPSIVITTPIASLGGDGIASFSEDDNIVLVGTTTNIAAGSRVSVTISDGSLTIGDTATVLADGTWALSGLNLSAMANGTISVSAAVTDPIDDIYYTNTSFLHDKSATVAIDSISLDTGATGDFITKDSTVSISGSATANAAVLVLVKNSGGTTVATFNLTASAAGTWSSTDTAALAVGNYTIQATVGGTTVTKAMTIVDAVAPTLTASTPVDNATGILAGANLTLTFSKTIQAGAGAISLYLANGTLVESFDVATGMGDAGGTITFNGTTGVTLNPFANLANNTGYYVNVGTTAVIDSAGNTYAGISNATTLNFTSELGDVTPPTVSIVVTDSALSVGETTLVTFTFSEAVTGFDNTDLTIANGTLGAVSTANGGITWTATFTPNANVTDTSN